MSEDLSQTQGEILSGSVEQLLVKMALTEDDVFVDLGSGKGEMVAQVFLRSKVKEARGIEIVPTLHQTAVNVAKTIQQEVPKFFVGGRQLNYQLGNFLEVPLAGASVIFVNGICFSPQLLNSLGKLIDGVTSVRMVAAVRPILSLARLRFQQAFRIECSWDSARCYIYS